MITSQELRALVHRSSDGQYVWAKKHSGKAILAAADALEAKENG